MQAFFRVLRHKCSHIPLFGPIFYASKEDHQIAVKELLISIGLSTVTFWGTALFLLALKSSAGQGYFDLIFNTVKHGELFIFSVGLLGPIIIAISEDKDDHKKQGRVWQVVMLTAIAIFAAGFHAQIKSAQFEGRSATLDDEFLFAASVVIAVFAIVFRYIALLYRRAHFPITQELKRPEKSFADSFAARHGQESK